MLFLVCTIPFWTSNIIRMISWIPFLGRNGLMNSALLQLGRDPTQPLEFLLFSDFSVVLAYVHLYTLFMVVPIFNSMMRIDRSLLEAARDAGASGWQTLWNVIMPLCKPGIAIGSIFVVTIVMGDFVTVRLMSGGQSASVGLMMMNAMSLLQYPAAAANAVVLLVGGAADGRRHDAPGRHPQGAVTAARAPRSRAFWLLAGFFALFVLFLYGPTHHHRDPVVPGAGRRPDLPDARRVAALVRQPVREAGGRRFRRLVRSARSRSALVVMVVTVLVSLAAGLAFRSRFRGCGRAVLSRPSPA